MKDHIAVLRQAGYIVLHIEPIIWRIRGPYGYVDVWPLQSKYRAPYAKELTPYADIQELLEHVRSAIEPWDEPDDELIEASHIWQNCLADLRLTYPQMFTCGK